MSKNLIYICLFESQQESVILNNVSQKNKSRKSNNDKEFTIFNLFLESLQLFCGFDNKDTDILIYTSTVLKKKLIELPKILKLKEHKHIFYRIYDKANSTSLAKFDIFDIINRDKYKKYLYLDNNILLINDIKIIFDLITDDHVIYSVKSNDLEKQHKFDPEILLFNNSENNKKMFHKIQDNSGNNLEINEKLENKIVIKKQHSINKRNSITKLVNLVVKEEYKIPIESYIDIEKLDTFVVAIKLPELTTRSTTILSKIIPSDTINYDFITFIKVDDINRITMLSNFLKFFKKKRTGHVDDNISNTIRFQVSCTFFIIAIIIAIVIVLVLFFKPA